jgi:polyhydroxyalkanoate synthesis repressor PhaR
MLDKAKSADGADRPQDKREPVVIKKYANRRLYNTETSTYVTLDDLAAMVRSERDFVVYDAKTGDELTHSVLTQIIVEQESRMGTETLLPVPFLQQLIRFYGGSMQKMVPTYLQFSLASFAKEQERIAKQFGGQFGALTPASAFEAFQEQARKNVAMFEQAMQHAMTMFNPFAQAAAGAKPAVSPRPEMGKPAAPASDAKPAANRDDELDAMKAQLAAMQAMIDKLSNAR